MKGRWAVVGKAGGGSYIKYGEVLCRDSDGGYGRVRKRTHEVSSEERERREEERNR